MAYQGALHPDGTPVQGMPDGMQGRTMNWDSPADMMGPDGECYLRPFEPFFCTRLVRHPCIQMPGAY